MKVFIKWLFRPRYIYYAHEIPEVGHKICDCESCKPRCENCGH